MNKRLINMDFHFFTLCPATIARRFAAAFAGFLALCISPRSAIRPSPHCRDSAERAAPAAASLHRDRAGHRASLFTQNAYTQGVPIQPAITQSVLTQSVLTQTLLAVRRPHRGRCTPFVALPAAAGQRRRPGRFGDRATRSGAINALGSCTTAFGLFDAARKRGMGHPAG